MLSKYIKSSASLFPIAESSMPPSPSGSQLNLSALSAAADNNTNNNNSSSSNNSKRAGLAAAIAAAVPAAAAASLMPPAAAAHSRVHVAVSAADEDSGLVMRPVTALASEDVGDVLPAHEGDPLTEV